jgi:hypothetical protein
LGLFASAVCKRASSAALLSYGLVFGVYVGIPLALNILNEIKSLMISEKVRGFMSPIFAFAVNLDRNHRISPITGFWAANIACFTALALWILWGARRVFARRHAAKCN